MTSAAPWQDTVITGVTCDSRKVAPGFLFAALPGSGDDGRLYIDEALGRGAAAILAPPPVDAELHVPLLLDGDSRPRYAKLAARFFNKQPATIAAVTGTNGKTSVVSFTRQLWAALGQQAASLGTLGLTAPGREDGPGLTTPDAADLHKTLADLATAGIHKLAMEASSQGLAQCRMDGVRVTVAAFTNLSHEHLDYHGGMNGYLAAKNRLFAEILDAHGTAVLNADDETFATLQATAEKRGLKVLSYGRVGADIRLDDVRPTPTGQRLEITVLGQTYEIDLPLSGSFQADNALCALGLVLADGADAAMAVKALESLEVVPGRMELVTRLANGAAVYLDYAHTPAALKTILGALGPHTEGQLKIVFGCGGDRDTEKRSRMGRIAADLSDTIYVTDDNPRGEDATTIRRQILEACPGAVEIADRAEAITTAVAGLQAGDVLIVAGKGHETGQIVGETVHPFNDANEIGRAVTLVNGEAKK